ncbi:hypothetical protein S7711_10946 [Stachybotrys chartarum IBT 7711]|uniref:Uncharacterized protein n=1 Tax=Stachybotrys chartarum (strain CBS 109288 / IBT 7711) TaxID=1280523 RepID=A0A084AHG6_STACB|nr:hypothetical protein S7711_10946 [Stachybotrys chartarum IBT 7711]
MTSKSSAYIIQGQRNRQPEAKISGGWKGYHRAADVTKSSAEKGRRLTLMGLLRYLGRARFEPLPMSLELLGIPETLSLETASKFVVAARPTNALRCFAASTRIRLDGSNRLGGGNGKDPGPDAKEAHLGYLGANTSNRRKGQAEVEEGRPVKSPTPPPSSRVPRIYRMASVSAGRGAQTQLERARIPEVQGLSSSRSWADGDASR